MISLYDEFTTKEAVMSYRSIDLTSYVRDYATEIYLHISKDTPYRDYIGNKFSSDMVTFMYDIIHSTIYLDSNGMRTDLSFNGAILETRLLDYIFELFTDIDIDVAIRIEPIMRAIYDVVSSIVKSTYNYGDILRLIYYLVATSKDDRYDDVPFAKIRYYLFVEERRMV